MERPLLFGALIWLTGSQTRSLGDSESQKGTLALSSLATAASRAALLDCKEQGIIGEYVEVSILK